MSDDYEYEMEIFINPDSGDTASARPGSPLEAAVRQRLQNLGYGTDEPLEHQIQAFQRDSGLAVTGRVEDAIDELKQRHDQCNPPLRLDENA